MLHMNIPSFLLRLRLRCLHPTTTTPPLRIPSTIRSIPNNPTFAHRYFHSTRIMSDVVLQLTAPNGRKYSQPIGLFINNEFVPSKSGEKLATINPS